MLFNCRATDVVRTRPKCDAPQCSNEAAVDAATGRGAWGYFCTTHHNSLCGGRLGMGVGQVLLCGDDYDDELKAWYDLEEET